MEPKNEILPFEWVLNGKGKNTRVYEKSAMHCSRHFMYMSSIQSHICEASHIVSLFMDGETEA